MRLQLTQTRNQEDHPKDRIEQGMTPAQWYAMQMSATYNLQKEMKELRRQESEKYLRALRSIDNGIGHFIHTIHR